MSSTNFHWDKIQGFLNPYCFVFTDLTRKFIKIMGSYNLISLQRDKSNFYFGHRSAKQIVTV